MQDQVKNADNKKKNYFLGWLVLIGPISIILFLVLFHGLPWVEKESKRGAQAEALTSNSMGLVAMNENRYQEAFNYFISAINTKKDYAEPYMNIGILYYMMGDHDLAKQYLKKSIEFNPKKKNMIYNNLGMVYAAQAEFDTALVMFHTALDLGIKPAPIWRNIAQVEEQRENWEGAIHAYQKVIENQPTLQNMYMESLREAYYEEENDDYFEYVEEKVEEGIDKNELENYDSKVVDYFLSDNEKLAEDYKDLGIAYEKAGQINQAIASFMKAIEIKPDWADIYNRIGIIYARNGYYAEAEKAFLEAINVDPGNQNAKMNLDKLRSGK